MNTGELIAGLPGEDLIRQGLEDYQHERSTVAAALVRIARPRLAGVGLLTDAWPEAETEPELELYRLLQEQGGDAYSRYNALLRELVSFEMALDRRFSRANAVVPQ